MKKEYAAKMEKLRSKHMTPALEEFEKDLYALLNETECAVAVFKYEGKFWGTCPLEDEEMAYRLMGRAVMNLASAYGKSPRVILSEINAAIKEVQK